MLEAIEEIKQGTPEWKALRCGKVTGSRIVEVLAKGSGESRETYLADLVVERLTGEPLEDGFKSQAMQDGNDREAHARLMYEATYGVTVKQVAFVDHPTILMAGCSPDGLVGDAGMVQIKCPMRKAHLRILRGKLPDGKYVKQVQWEMACTQRMWSEFVSYNPTFPLHMQLAKIRIPRDSAMIVEMEREVRAFQAELSAALADLAQRSEAAA